jgi:protein-S-isoprenylcysteine O-methyltransferase Ste14
MSMTVVIIRILPLFVFAGAMWLGVRGHREEAKWRGQQGSGKRAPVAANVAALGSYVASLLLVSGSSTASAALVLAAAGSLLALVGVGIVVWSRRELGAAWSFAPMANETTGLVTTGPYGVVRHPIYLGLTLVTLGQAIGCANWVAVLIVAFAVIPTLVWRARAEERLLRRTFGERYAAYRKHTRMIIPHVL